MSGAEIPIGMAVVGTGLQIAGQLNAAASAAEAAERQAYIKGLQADELLSREVINEGLIREQGEYAALHSYTGAGREGAGLGGILKIKKDVETTIANNRREAEFKAKMLRMGADVDLELASDSRSAGYLTGAGTLLSGGAQAYSIFKGPGKNTSLPGGK